MIRHTIEATPTSPELIAFTADEATLSVRAISYYVATSLQTLEANWDSQALFAGGKSVEDANGDLERTAGFVNFFHGLAMKLSGSVEQPDAPVELSTEDIMGLGEALFRLGNSGVMHSRRALTSGRVGFHSQSDRVIVAGKVEELGQNTFDLFKKLEPIAKSKDDYSWMIWEEPPALPGLSLS